jgi:hypothetical protein
LFYSYSIKGKRIAVKKAGGAPDENGSLLKTLTKGGKDKTISSSSPQQCHEEVNRSE